MNCENCGELGKIKYRYQWDNVQDVTIFCEDCFDLMVKLNRGAN